MDNLCHTLVGAALSEAGLKRRTRFAGVALMVSANLPDVDVAVFAFDTSSLAFRRGWTHGMLAQLLLPLVFTGVMLLVARRVVRGERDAHTRYRGLVTRNSAGGIARDERRVSAGWLLILSYIGLYSHVFLDYLNTYGIRLLAPLDWRWFYGDAVFIIDPWLWLSLGLGVYLARRWLSERPARMALVVAGSYIAVMLLSTMAAGQVVAAAWREARGAAPRALMVGPVPAVPFRREVIVDAGTHYEIGRFSWWPLDVRFDPEEIPKQSDRPEVAEAVRQSRSVRGFLAWSRFPFWTFTATPAGTRVTVTDARFMASGARFSASTIVTEPVTHEPSY